MKTISICLWNRPDYTLQILSALAKCPSIVAYKLIIHIDGGRHREVEALARCIGFAKSEIVVESHHLGCNENTRRALKHAFATSDYNIHVEDDVLLAPDALRYFAWGEQFRSDPSVFTVNAWRHDIGWLPEQNREMPPGEGARVGSLQFFNCWGWATWPDRWKQMEAGWTKGTDQTRSWDTAVHEARGDRLGLQPYISRATNIGAIGGTHRGHFLLPYWAGSPDFVAPETFNRV